MNDKIKKLIKEHYESNPNNHDITGLAEKISELEYQELLFCNGNLANKEFKITDKVSLIETSSNFNLTFGVCYEILKIPPQRDGIILIRDNKDNVIEVKASLFDLRERMVELNLLDRKINI